MNKSIKYGVWFCEIVGIICMFILMGINAKVGEMKNNPKTVAKNTTTDKLQWKDSKYTFTVQFIKKTDTEMMITMSDNTGKEIAIAFLNTDSPMPEYKWFGRWEESLSDNWGYVRFNEIHENGKIKFVGEQTNGRYSDEFMHQTVIE